MESIYQKIFEVKIWHDYFLPREMEVLPTSQYSKTYDIEDFITIEPTEECQSLLNKHRLLFKQTQTGFVVLGEVIEVENQSKSYSIIPLTGNLKFSFVAQIKDPYFLNYTNLPLENESPTIYYATNLNDNQLRLTIDELEDTFDFLYLTKSIPGYLTSVDYDFGDLVRVLEDPGDEDSGLIYEVIDLPIMTLPTPESEPEDSWLSGKNSQYLTSRDGYKLLGNSYEYREQDYDSDLKGQLFNFVIKDQAGKIIPLGIRDIPDANIPIEQAEYPADGESPLVHQLDLRNLPDGKYTLGRLMDSGAPEEFLFYFIKLSSSNRGGKTPFILLDIFSSISQEPKYMVPETYQFANSEEVPIGNNGETRIVTILQK